MAKKAKRNTRRWTWLRYRKNDHAHNIQASVQKWIHANGGTALVIGGIGIMQGHGPGSYYVTVSIVGIQPFKEESKKNATEA